MDDPSLSTSPAEACRFRAVALVPTYNNAGTLLDVLEQIEQADPDLAIIVVNDGATDSTQDKLDQWRKAQTHARHEVIVHTENLGKAEALNTGFRTARRAGFSHVATIDSDGQLDPAELPMMLECAKQNPASLILGVRDSRAADYPRRSRIGRLFANAAVKLETGVRVRDTQCGFRVYPLDLLKHVRCRTGRYAYETEVLTRAVWAGAGIVERPVTCTYTPKGGRVSHFRPGADTLHGLLMHARLILITLLPIPHAHPWHDPNGRDRKAADPRPRWRRIIAWINPLEAWRNIKAGELRRDELAASLAIGVFIGNLPLYGMQTLLCIYSAARLHLNPHLVLAGSTISTPPIGLGLVAAAIVVGHLVVRGKLISFTEVLRQDESEDTVAVLGQVLLEWTVGSIIVGGALAIITLFLSFALFGRLQKRLHVPDEEDAVKTK